MTISQREIYLVNGFCDGSLSDADFLELEIRLRESHELRQLLIDYRSIESAVPSALASGTMEMAEASATKRSLVNRRLKIALLAMAAVLVLMFGLYSLRPNREPQIATLRSLAGPVRWTAAGGKVVDDVQAGHALTGGTFECVSSAVLEFLDGSTVTVSGGAVLTISDDGRKELHLRGGRLSATVTSQPEGKPLRLLTATAELEVLGTQFDVIVADTQTKVTVCEGLVGVKRLTDGAFAEVSEAHALVVTIEAQEQLVATPISAPLHAWVANLAKDKMHGEWVSAGHALEVEIRRAIEAGEITRDEIQQVYGDRLHSVHEHGGFLRASPRRIGNGGRIDYFASLRVSHRQNGPIRRVEGSRFQIQGKVVQPCDVLFGFSAANRDKTINGEFAARRRIESNFEVEIPVAEFQHDLSGGRAVSAEQLDFSTWWCSTRKPGLQITHVELVAP